MASHIPSTRLGRALKAGIPVALIMAGADLVDGAWHADRSGNGLVLSWTAARDEGPLRLDELRPQPAIRLTACLGKGCERWSLALSLPRHHAGTEILSFARSIIDAVSGKCPEKRQRKTIALLA